MLFLRGLHFCFSSFTRLNFECYRRPALGGSATLLPELLAGWADAVSSNILLLKFYTFIVGIEVKNALFALIHAASPRPQPGRAQSSFTVNLAG